MSGFYIALLAFILALGAVEGASSVTVTPFTACNSSCGVNQAYFPSATSYLLVTSDQTLWLSLTEGQTWTYVLGGVSQLYGSAADPQYVIFQVGTGTRAKYYSTNNGGQTIAQIMNFPTPAVSGITLHPNQPNWLLIYSCSGNPMTCTTWYSKNFGTTWSQGPSNLMPYYILWSTDSDTTAQDVIFGVTSGGHFSYTPDYSNNWVTLLDNCIGYVLTDNFLYVGVLTPDGKSARLYSSSKRQDATHTIKANYWLSEFPSGNNLPEYGYTFLDDSARSEYLAVQQSTKNSWGTVYTSDFDGDQFVLSKNWVYESGLTYDFAKFNGLEGMYMLNAFPNATSSQRQTFFTFDNGGEWKLLTAPQTDSKGKNTNCAMSKGCSLHLLGPTSWYSGTYPPFYTSENAIGLMLAVGNIGSGLDFSYKTTKTYFTRDAGITWVELYSKPTIYEFGDHGGILVFADNTAATTNIMYSLDEGKTIQTFAYTSTAMYVDNIFTEPAGTSQKFVMYCHTGSGVARKNYIFGLDFSTLGLPQCTDDDYENWSPQNDDNVNNLCFLGEVLVYSRRKQDSQCFNAREYDNEVSSTKCACAWEDYECDVGYTATTRNETDYFDCIPPPYAVPACATGYRKIPDTACENGLSLEASNCPGYSGSPTLTSTTSAQASGVSTTTGGGGKKGGHTGAVVGVTFLFIIIFGGAAAAGFLYWKNENFRDWVLSRFQRRGEASYGRLSMDDDNEEGGAAIIN